MAFFRVLAIVLPIAILLLGLGYLGTGDRRYLAWAITLLKVAIVAGLVFFGVLFVDRLLNPAGESAPAAAPAPAHGAIKGIAGAATASAPIGAAGARGWSALA